MNLEKLINELKYVGILFVVALVIFKIVFYKEGLFVVLRTVFALFYMFVLPGYMLMYYWNERLGFSERFIIGMALSLGVIGMSSYYLGLVGLHIKYHFILPLLLVGLGFFVNWRKK